MKKLYILISQALLAVLIHGCAVGEIHSTSDLQPGQQPGQPGRQPNTPSIGYTDPTTGTYQLRMNPTLTTAIHLVLDLWGPAGVSGSGLTVSLTLGEGASWSNVNGTDSPGAYIANGTVFDLSSGTPILKARVNGNALSATISEKGFASPKALDGPLLRVGLDLAASSTRGMAISLSADNAKCKALLGDGTLLTITVTPGTLSVL